MTEQLAVVPPRMPDSEMLPRGLAGALAEQPLLIPIPRVARLLGISRSAAYRYAACGDLPTTHLGGRVYVVTAKLRELLESA